MYNILAFNFAGQDTAKETVKRIRSSGALEGYKIAAEAIVEQDLKGKVHIHEPGKGGLGATVSAVGGGLLGLIGGPIGVLAWAVGDELSGQIASYFGSYAERRRVPYGDRFPSY